MRSFPNRVVRRLVAKVRSARRRASLRWAAAGPAGMGGHLGWLDYERVIYRAVEYQYWENRAGVIPLGSYYEFGLLEGRSFTRCYRTLGQLARDLGFAGVAELGVHLVGFDSFEGLPEPGASDRRVGWVKGAMACGRDRFESNMRRGGVPAEAYQLVAGFYETSLTDALRQDLARHPPGLVLMDCDFYSSTRTVLEWLRPMLRDGCFFLFDDIWAYMGHPDHGELRAIREFNAEGPGLLVPHPLGGASGQVYVYTTGYSGAPYQAYLAGRTGYR
ncbi:MAG TPA: TylF/MycF/NovP-related O-methyltransferase [Methylibium sp.]|nr:TylF/MycF/NovP-related O-methyltransferase [Methylibium sp.]